MSTVYFDNNATTIMPKEVQQAMIKWTNQGNPSAGYASAKRCREMMDDLRKKIGLATSVETTTGAVGPSTIPQYRVIFTSGASEANCLGLRALLDAYTEHVGPAHMVISRVEHKSIIEFANSMIARGKMTVGWVTPRVSGRIAPEDVEREIRGNTCVIVCMHANNETGAINDISRIGQIAHKHNAVYFCDIVQSFGKIPVDLRDVDCASVSFHKVHGPPGCGAMITKSDLLRGWRIDPMIFGTQNEGLRGGTENVPGLGAASVALAWTAKNRSAKNASTLRRKMHIMRELSKRYKTCSYRDYRHGVGVAPQGIVIVFISGADAAYLPGTLLFSVVKHSEPHVCNVEMRKELESMGVVVSVGSACNTASDKASHVLYALDADEHVRRGTLRVSLGDHNTDRECEKFIAAMVRVIDNQVKKSG